MKILPQKEPQEAQLVKLQTKKLASLTTWYEDKKTVIIKSNTNVRSEEHTSELQSP